MKRIKLKAIHTQKADYRRLLFDVRLKCAECFGYFADGYQECTPTECPLRPYFPTKQQYNSIIRTKEYQRRKHEAFS